MPKKKKSKPVKLLSFTPDLAFDLLTARGVAYARLTFSGGNDSGAVDSCTLFYLNGQEDPLRCIAYNQYALGDDGKFYCPDGEGPVEPTKEISDAFLEDLLTTPVYNAYGSFAGEYDVSGEVIYDCANRTIKMTGTESAPEYFERMLFGDEPEIVSLENTVDDNEVQDGDSISPLAE